METYNIEINKKYEVTSQDIDDIMATALDSISYWCRKAKVVGEYLGEYASDQISRGGSLILYDAESNDCWELNLENLLHGIEKAIEERNNWLQRDDELTEFDSDESCINNYLWNSCGHKYITQAFSVECRNVININGIDKFYW